MWCALCIDKQCTQGKDCTNIADNITVIRRSVLQKTCQ